MGNTMTVSDNKIIPIDIKEILNELIDGKWYSSDPEMESLKHVIYSVEEDFYDGYRVVNEYQSKSTPQSESCNYHYGKMMQNVYDNYSFQVLCYGEWYEKARRCKLVDTVVSSYNVGD